jgi:hypothetical protein
MTSSEGIRRLGFRRWYERQLIEGHVYLITCVLSAVLVLACIEALDWRGSAAGFVLMLFAAAAGSSLAIASLRRYQTIVTRAEWLGEQSTCTACRTYGLLEVLDAGAADGERETIEPRADNTWIRVRCRNCGHEWPMDIA